MGLRICMVSNTDELGCMVVRNLLIKLLRDRYPDSHIVVLAEERFIDRVRKFHRQASWVDECLAIESEQAIKPLQKLKLWRLLKAQRFDTIIYSPGSKIPYWIPYLCGIPTRVGLGLGRSSWQCRCLNHVAELEEPYHIDTHWISLIKSYAQALGIDDFKEASAHVPFLRVEERIHAPEDSAAVRVVVHVGGNPGWNRRWPLKNFLRLCKLLASEANTAIDLLGSSSEAYENKLIVEEVKNDNSSAAIADVSGGTVQDTASYIAEADLFIGNDSGPMNMAAALGTPIVAIRGADPENFRPDAVDSKHLVLSGWANCSRRRNGTNDCDFGCPIAYDRSKQEYPKCMETISFESVWNAVERQLNLQTAPKLPTC